MVNPIHNLIALATALIAAILLLVGLTRRAAIETPPRVALDLGLFRRLACGCRAAVFRFAAVFLGDQVVRRAIYQ